MKQSFLFMFFISIFFAGCVSSPKVKQNDDSFINKQTENQQEEIITMCFAGDVMAHKPNYSIKDFSKIWSDIQDISSSTDLSFANIEAPVSDNLPFSTYPEFNMNSSYTQEMIDAGFNIFSLVNNHTNDQKLNGMIDTLEWANKKENETKDSERPLYFCGINKTDKDGLAYKIFSCKNFKILFLATTEILNRPDYRSYMNYVPSSKKSHDEFIQKVKNIRETNECDLFILSLHSDEPEYVKPVSSMQKNYYYNLLEAGVDVIWANHPHVVREREIIGNKESGKLKKIIMYGNGNTISAQRLQPQFEKPETLRDDTGDGLIFFVCFSKNILTNQIEIIQTKPYYITTYINSENEFLIKKLDNDFIEYLEKNRPSWVQYIRARKKITEQTKETIIWQ